ncbi:hypothetical protein, partial [Pseudomonas syringae]|uniref:hypothetical protein n=1 Tax=Pseudomonas syringae TaxID=317 RepID=UPI001C821F1A
MKATQMAQDVAFLPVRNAWQIMRLRNVAAAQADSAGSDGSGFAFFHHGFDLVGKNSQVTG